MPAVSSWYVSEYCGVGGREGRWGRGEVEVEERGKARRWKGNEAR